MVILDTCCLIELCLEKPSLTQQCLKKIDKGALILSISFAEIACKIKVGKLKLNLSAEELYHFYKSITSIKIADIGCEEWFDSINLKWQVKDPADRLIVGYARRTNCPIVTTDKQIKKFYKKVLW